MRNPELSEFSTPQDTRNPGPDFICVGMPKAGTGWLYDQLQPHPDFWMPPAKELHYLGQAAPEMGNSVRAYERFQREPEKRAARLVNSRQWDARDIEFFEQVMRITGEPRNFQSYRSLFRSKGNLLSGDVTPNYSALPDEQIAEIGQQLPHIRVLLLVRDPIARAWSHISMRNRMGSFNERLLTRPQKFRLYLEKARTLRKVSFATQVARAWAANAPHIEFRYFFFDEIAKNPEKIRREVLLYLGADPEKASGKLTADFNRKSKKAKLDLTDELKSQLVEHFEGELRESAALFGGYAKAWLAQYGFQG